MMVILLGYFDDDFTLIYDDDITLIFNDGISLITAMIIHSYLMMILLKMMTSLINQHFSIKKSECKGDQRLTGTELARWCWRSSLRPLEGRPRVCRRCPPGWRS